MDVVIDTNVLIDHPEVLLDKSINPIIPYMVLSELDNLKRNPNIKRAAQSAIKLLYAGLNDGSVKITDIPKDLQSPDEKIVKSAQDLAIPIMTQDIGCRAIALSKGVRLTKTLEDESIDYDYTGYIKIEGTSEYEKSMCQLKEMQDAEFEYNLGVSLKENQFCIINRLTGKKDIWHNLRGRVSRVFQSVKPLKDAEVMDVPLDEEQACVISAVMNPEIPLVVVSGKVGSGKSILSLMGALACVRGQKRHRHYEKIIVTRPPVSVNKNMQLGFLPGSLEDKMGDWIGGIKSNLKFLLEKDQKSKELEKAQQVFVESFEMLNLDSIQGVSLHNSILLVDEWQLLDTDMLKLVLSRIAEGSKVVLIGDTEGQTYGINRSNEGFKTLYKHLGKAPEMCYIKLDNIYRSALTSFVEEIFN